MEDKKVMCAEDMYRTLWARCLKPRRGADALLEALERGGFFNAPASKRHHLATPGGLCLHSCNVARRALELCRTPAFAACDTHAVTVAALLHDICKMGRYVPVTKWLPGEEKSGKSYEYCDERMLGHGEESVIMAMEYITLTKAEQLAIRWHMGAYADPDKLDAMSRACDACPEVMCVHFADMIATHDEK